MSLELERAARARLEGDRPVNYGQTQEAQHAPSPATVQLLRENIAARSAALRAPLLTDYERGWNAAMADRKWEDAVREELRKAYTEGFKDAEARRESQVPLPAAAAREAVTVQEAIANLRGARRISKP